LGATSSQLGPKNISECDKVDSVHEFATFPALAGAFSGK